MTKRNLPQKNNDNKWMVVYITYDLQDAHIVSGRLKHEGIPNFVHTQAGAGAMGITVGLLGEIQVVVRPEDYDLAEFILFGDDDDEPDDDMALPDGDNDDVIDGGTFDE